jgi:itaconate CoA-transferase
MFPRLGCRRHQVRRRGRTIDTHYVVTEFGAINVKGLSPTQRALKLIELAHPEFRAGLREAAKAQHLI